MSKPTLQERAREYLAFSMGMRLPLIDQEQNQTWRHLTEFAAQEVARVREMQAKPVKELREMDKLFRLFDDARLTAPVQAIDAATRPERPGRAKVKKPYPPMATWKPGLSALAKTTKKAKR